MQPIDGMFGDNVVVIWPLAACCRVVGDGRLQRRLWQVHPNQPFYQLEVAGFWMGDDEGGLM